MVHVFATGLFEPDQFGQLHLIGMAGVMLTVIFFEGHDAFREGIQRIASPYRFFTDEVHTEWLKGWDQARIEDQAKAAQSLETL
jgi:hypothetical protein